MIIEHNFLSESFISAGKIFRGQGRQPVVRKLLEEL